MLVRILGFFLGGGGGGGGDFCFFMLSVKYICLYNRSPLQESPSPTPLSSPQRKAFYSFSASKACVGKGPTTLHSVGHQL